MVACSSASGGSNACFFFRFYPYQQAPRCFRKAQRELLQAGWRLRDAKMLYSGNEAYALELLAEASQMLAKAEAFDARS
jgi:hypothetical protein